MQDSTKSGSMGCGYCSVAHNRGTTAFMESVKKSDRKAWRAFLQQAFVLRVMAESMNNLAKPAFDNNLTADEERDLFAAVNAAQQSKKRREHPPKGK
jgi:hypothetical protein